jgi:hypothetical protein
MSEDEYLEHREEFDGYCTHCEDWTACGGTEPDARNYPCPDCGADTVFGAEEILMMGILEIEG